MASSSSRPASRATSVRINKDEASNPTVLPRQSTNLHCSPSPVQMQLPKLHLIHAEITAVTSAMRKSNRFNNPASSSSSNFNQHSSLFQSTASTALTKGAVHAAATTLQGLGGLMANERSNGNHQDSSNEKTPSTPLALSMGLRTTQNQSKIEGGREGTGVTARQDDTPSGLLAGFTILRAQLKEHPDLSTFPLPHLLSPFLRVILSPRTSAPITSAALQAVHKLLLYGLVRPPSSPSSTSSSQTGGGGVGAQLAIAEIAHATSHCRFEASDATVDELVLLRILAVMRELICEERADPLPSLQNLGVGNTLTEKELESQEGFKPRPQALADCLGEESICEMMETGLSMCCQMRLSDLLRRTAEQNLTSMIRTLFSRLSSIPTTADESFNPDPNSIATEPEHATLAAEPVGDDAEALNAADEKKLRRMTMPDPKSRAFPAAADVTSPNSASASNPLDVLKEMGEAEERAEREMEGSSPNEKELLQDMAADQEEKVEVEGKEEEKDAVEEDQEEVGSSVPQLSFAPMDVQPYGLPAIKEVLRVLVSLLDPENSQHTDTMRLLGLSMLCSVFEVAGSSLGRFPSLRGIIQDGACKFLFQLTRSENPTLMTYALRTTSTLFETMRDHLKLQQELFLTFLMEKLAPAFPVALEPWNEISLSAISAQKGLQDPNSNGRAGTPDLVSAAGAPPPPPPPPPMPKSSDRAPAQGEAREQILEAFGILFRSFDSNPSEDQMVNLWVNYDCDTDCENVFESVIRFLCRSVYAANPQMPAVQDSSQILALDAVLSFVSSMTSRQESEEVAAQSAATWPLNYPTIDSLVYSKGRKAAILAGAERFNAKPKDGMAYLEKEGFIDYSGKNGISKEKSIATFLKSCPRLDKKLLGDYISRPDNIQVLEAFLSLFDFRGKPVGEAIREMLESFRLPGESQQINRIAETFSKIYFNEAQPPEIASEDAVYVLTYSVIMLNTDLHNKQVKKRMALEDYRKNLRGVNDGQDFDPEYLSQIYDSIRRREIVMPEEHVGQLGFDFTWKELLRKSRTAGPLLEAHNSAVFDKAMFELAWRPVVAAIAHAFSTFQDEHLLERAISGFRQCAVLASRFGMVDMFDFMLRVLAGATGLLDASLPREMQIQGIQINGTPTVVIPNNAVVDVEDQKVTVSPLSVRFGMNFKGQLAAVVLFTIANGNGDAVRHGWAEIFEIFKNLFANSLLPPSMLEMTDFTSESGSVTIPLKPKKPAGPPPQDPRAQGGGLFSTLSSYLLSPYSAAQEQPPPEPTEQDVESSLCTIDCVYSCRIEDLYAQIRSLGKDALLPAVRALRELADRQTIDRLANRAAQSQSNASSSSGTSTPTLVNGGTGIQGQLTYDPSSLFVLEMLTTITCSSQDSLLEAWPLAFEHVSALLNAAKNLHPLLVERAVVSALRLVEVALSLNDEGLRDQSFVALDLMRSLPSEMRPAISTQLVTGVGRILTSRPSFARSQTEWGLLLALVSDNTSSRNAAATQSALESVRSLLSSKEASEGTVVTLDSFSSFVSLLRDFASAADTSVVREMRENQRRTLTEKKELQSFEEAAQERGTIAVPLLEGLKVYVPSIIEAASGKMSYSEAWVQFWLPLMQSLAQQCVNAHRATRQIAVTYLQRLLLAPEVLESSTSSSDPSKPPLFLLFTRVLFPVLNELLKPEVFRRDPNGPNGMQETRMRCCALLSKAFLHYLAQLSDESEFKKEDANGEEKPDFQTLWLKSLDFFDRFLNSGKRDQLTEAIPENLKNLLLVMNASGLLISPPAKGSPDERSERQIQLWKVSFDRIHRFLPGLEEELFPTPAPAPAVEVKEEEKKVEESQQEKK